MVNPYAPDSNQPPRAPIGPQSFDDRRMRWIGMLIVLIMFGGFGTWAVLAPLSSAAQAPGVTAVESYRKIMQHLEGASSRPSMCAMARRSRRFRC